MLYFIASTKLHLTEGAGNWQEVALEGFTHLLYLESLLQSISMFADLYLCNRNECSLRSPFLPKGNFSIHCCKQPQYLAIAMDQKYVQESLSWNTC